MRDRVSDRVRVRERVIGLECGDKVVMVVEDDDGVMSGIHVSVCVTWVESLSLT